MRRRDRHPWDYDDPAHFGIGCLVVLIATGVAIIVALLAFSAYLS